MRTLISLLGGILVLPMWAATQPAPPATHQSAVVIQVRDYGAKPDTHSDCLPAVRRAIEAAMAARSSVLTFEKGRYDFFPEEATRVDCHISNTTTERESSTATKIIGLYFKNATNLVIEGNGALFVFHGKMTTVMADHCENLEFRDFGFDFDRPTVSEIKVIARDGNTLDAQVHPASQYRIADGKLLWTSPYWTSARTGAQQYDPATDRTWRSWSPQTRATKVQEVRTNLLRLYFDRPPDTHPGIIFQMREDARDQVGVFMHRCHNLVWKDVGLHFAHGLGFVGQFSENLTFERVICAPRPETGRTCAGFADFMQMSGCAGKVRFLGCSYSGPQDDPINVHGTHLQVMSRPTPTQVLLRFMQAGSYGFEAFVPGDELDFIRNRSLQVFGSARVKSLTNVSPYQVLLTLDKPAPPAPGEPESVENATWTPEVEICGCRFARDPTRGILITTRRKVVIENNVFFRTTMDAINIADDARSWWESGMVRDVLIRSNQFVECGMDVIRIAPEVAEPDASKAVHRNIRIENNTFQMLGNTLLSARCTANLRFMNNTVVRAKAPASGQILPLLSFTACSGVAVEGNRFEGEDLDRHVLLSGMLRESAVILANQGLTVKEADITK